ncbi:hypothetical protein CSPX01_09718 [Colletotrichum filicis]|nr:hypothetical protein CSPX01_09718 [Colletotrichum filicis]
MTLRWDANLKRIAPKAARSRHPGLPLAQVLKQARSHARAEIGSANDMLQYGGVQEFTCYVVGGECRAPRQWAGRSKYGLQRLLASFSRAAEDEYEQELRVFQSSGVVLDTAPDGLGYSITEVLASRSAGNGTLEEKDDPCFKSKWPLLPRKQARSSFPTSTIPTGHAYCGMRVKDRPAGQNVAQPSNRTASRNVQSPQSLAWDRSSRGWPKDTAAAPVATRLTEVIGRALFWELERSDDVSRSSPQVLNG